MTTKQHDENKAVIKMGVILNLVQNLPIELLVVYKNKGHTGMFAGAERSSIRCFPLF